MLARRTRGSGTYSAGLRASRPDRTASFIIYESATCAARTRDAERPRADNSASHDATSSCRTSARVVETPSRMDVRLKQALVVATSGRLEIGLRLEPLLRPLADRDPRPRPVHVGAADNVGSDRVQPSLGVDLPREVTRNLPARRVSVASAPPSVRPLRDAGHTITPSVPRIIS